MLLEAYNPVLNCSLGSPHISLRVPQDVFVTFSEPFSSPWPLLLLTSSFRERIRFPLQADGLICSRYGLLD